MKSKKATTDRLVCYPMVGEVEHQYESLLKILEELRTDEKVRADLILWMQRSFGISRSFTQKVYSFLFQGMGLVQHKNKIYEVTDIGCEVLETKDPVEFFRLFSRTYFAVDGILEVLTQTQPAPWDSLRESWASYVRSKRKEPTLWSEQHLSSQLRFRVDWLRSMGLVDFVAGKYYLSRRGHELRRMDLEAAAPTAAQKERVAHNDIEDKLGLIGAFFQFDVKKRASVNDILPRSSQLKENRQVDSLWVRFVHFGGKLQYPFEVQLSGGMSDAIERLEMVANVVQKAVVITDAKQQEKMLDRLRVKRSALLDKLVFLQPGEVDKILEATIVMRSFTEAVFGE